MWLVTFLKFMKKIHENIPLLHGAVRVLGGFFFWFFFLVLSVPALHFLRGPGAATFLQLSVLRRWAPVHQCLITSVGR